jgi:hypothetical protein
MAKAIAGFFQTQAQGEVAKTALQRAGFTEQEVSYLAGDTRGHNTPAVGPALKDAGSESEAGGDAFVGGAIGLAAGVVAAVLPGIGPLIAIGPFAAAISGLAAGAAAGGLIGILKDHGISEEEAEFYAEGVRRGGALITVHGVEDDERKKLAQETLKDSGAIEVEQVADVWRKEGWTGRSPRTFRAG